MALPSIRFAAPIIRSAIKTLRADLPAQLAAFNNESVNEVELETPVVYRFGTNEPLFADGFPAVDVFVSDGKVHGHSAERLEADHDFNCGIVVWIEGDDGEVPPMLEKALGYSRCVIETMNPEGAFGGTVEVAVEPGISWRIDTIPADPAAREVQRWRTYAFVQFPLETVERFVP